MHRARTMVQLVGLVGVHAKLRFRRESQKEDLRKSGAGVRRPRVRRTRHGRDVLSLEPALSRYGTACDHVRRDRRLSSTRTAPIIVRLFSYSLAARREGARLERLGPVGQMLGQVRRRHSPEVAVLQQSTSAGRTGLQRMFRRVRVVQSEAVHREQ